MPQKDGDGKSRSEIAIQAIAIIMLCGIIAIVIFALNAPDIGSWLANASVGVIVAGASALVGGLLGFLFGIPRTLQGDSNASGSNKTHEGAGEQSAAQKVSYQANTNLEQISDWLTKILVGVGLTQLTSIPAKLETLANFIAPGLDAVSEPSVLALAILIYFTICGFLFSYLWTRLHFATALREADVQALTSKVEEAGEKVSRLERQSSLDAKALSLVQRHLDPHPDSETVPKDELHEAIVKASPSVKTTIYYKAWEIRRRNWRDKRDKHKMERTIPIFQALVDSDVDNEYHANHGQLGFALKDMLEPDWVRAEAELTKAIEIRGDWKIKRWLFYELNRAICRIMIAESEDKGEPSSPETKDKIMQDLRTAAESKDLSKLIIENPIISNWMKQNQVKKEQLHA